MTINGKKNSLRREDFAAFALHLGIPEKACRSSLDRLRAVRTTVEEGIEHSRLPAEKHEPFRDIVRERSGRMYPGGEA